MIALDKRIKKKDIKNEFKPPQFHVNQGIKKEYIH